MTSADLDGPAPAADDRYRALLAIWEAIVSYRDLGRQGREKGPAGTCRAGAGWCTMRRYGEGYGGSNPLMRRSRGLTTPSGSAQQRSMLSAPGLGRARARTGGHSA
jgi:hypothetical protein